LFAGGYAAADRPGGQAGFPGGCGEFAGDVVFGEFAAAELSEAECGAAEGDIPGR
jgi:hypothetical protein